MSAPTSKDKIVTSDLSRFGFHELEMAAQLLSACCDNPPEFLGDGVTIMLNMWSSNVFLTDEDYNVGMMNGDTLEQFHMCFECGAEGFADQIKDHECS